MPYKVKGAIDSECRIMLIDENTVFMENTATFPGGYWMLVADDGNPKLVIARKLSDGQAAGFSGVIPIMYEDIFLAINNSGDYLSIDGLDNNLLVQ